MHLDHGIQNKNKMSSPCSKSDFMTEPVVFLIFSVQTNSDFKIGLKSGLESDFEKTDDITINGFKCIEKRLSKHLVFFSFDFKNLIFANHLKTSKIALSDYVQVTEFKINIKK